MLFNQIFDQCYRKLTEKFQYFGIALETIVKDIYQLLIGRNMPGEQKIFLVKRLGDIQYRLSIGCQEKICLASLIGSFI